MAQKTDQTHPLFTVLDDIRSVLQDISDDLRKMGESGDSLPKSRRPRKVPPKPR